MLQVHAWLQEQERQGVKATFFCNWRLTERVHLERRVSVYLSPHSGAPVAYQWGGLLKDGILEVRHAERGRGIGRVMVEHMMAEAELADEPILFVHCAPDSSAPFWQRMGFTLLPEHRGETYGYRIVPKQLPPPAAGKPVQVDVEFYSERRGWDADIPPRQVNTQSAVRDSNGSVWLSHRVSWFDTIPTFEGDSYAIVKVDGENWYSGKLKRERASILGFKACANGYHLDRLFPVTSPA